MLASGRTRGWASKDIQQGDKTAISSCEDVPDFKQEDFATVFRIISLPIYPRVKDPYKDMDKRAILGDAEVKRFLKKAEIKLLGYCQKSPKCNTTKQLMSHKMSFFKNKTTKDVKYMFQCYVLFL